MGWYDEDYGDIRYRLDHAGENYWDSDDSQFVDGKYWDSGDSYAVDDRDNFENSGNSGRLI